MSTLCFFHFDIFRIMSDYSHNSLPPLSFFGNLGKYKRRSEISTTTWSGNSNVAFFNHICVCGLCLDTPTLMKWQFRNGNFVIIDISVPYDSIITFFWFNLRAPQKMTCYFPSKKNFRYIIGDFYKIICIFLPY